MAKKKRMPSKPKIAKLTVRKGRPVKKPKGQYSVPFTVTFEVSVPEFKGLSITGPKWTRTPHPPDRQWDMIDF